MSSPRTTGWTEKRRRNILTAREWFEPVKLYEHDDWSRAIYFDDPYLEIHEAGASEKKFGKFIMKVTSTFHDPVSFEYLEDAIITAFSFALVSDKFRENANRIRKKFSRFFECPDISVSFGMGSLWKPWMRNSPFVISTDLMHVNDIDPSQETSYEQYPRIVGAFREFLSTCNSRGIRILSRKDFDTFSIIETEKDNAISYFLDDRTTNPALYADSVVDLVRAYQERRLMPFDKNDPDIVESRIDAWFDEHEHITPSEDQKKDPTIVYKGGCLEISLVGESRRTPYIRIDIRDQRLPNPRVASLFAVSFTPPYISDCRLMYTPDANGEFHVIRMYLENLKREIKNNVIAPMKIARQIYRDVYDELVKYLGYRPYYPLP